MKEYLQAYKKAFPYTIPVLTGYIFIGIAFGVLFSEKGYNALWAMFMSSIVLAGAGQYLAVNFFVPGFSFVQIAVMTILVNIRHVFYGLSMLKKFEGIGKKRWYMIFTLTDENYSLLCSTKVPEGMDKGKFNFAMVSLDHAYWVIGSGIGAGIGMLIPFNAEGIDFAMTALFLVIFTEQAFKKENWVFQIIGLVAAFIALQIFGADQFVMPAMIAVTGILLIFKNRFEGRRENAD